MDWCEYVFLLCGGEREGWGNLIRGRGGWGTGYDGDGDNFVGGWRKGKEFWGHLDIVDCEGDFYSGETDLWQSLRKLAYLSH